jgi:hypothetical protein
MCLLTGHDRLVRIRVSQGSHCNSTVRSHRIYPAFAFSGKHFQITKSNKNVNFRWNFPLVTKLLFEYQAIKISVFFFISFKQNFFLFFTKW